MYEFLSDEVWQGVGAIAGIVAVIISLWQARKPPSKSKSTNKTLLGDVGRRIATILSLLIPTYSIFVGSILLVNTLTKTPERVVYGAVAIASLLGLIWGIVWATYIKKVFFESKNQRTARKSTIKEV